MQKLLKYKNYYVCWLLYGDEFKIHLTEWSHKCNNKILDYETSLIKIAESDVIIFQEIIKEKSSFSNLETLQNLKKTTCRLIKMPSIYLDYNNYAYSLQELNKREIEKNADIKVSRIINYHKKFRLMITNYHPNTFLFLEIIKILCTMLKMSFFNFKEYLEFMKNNNYMNLPT